SSGAVLWRRPLAPSSGAVVGAVLWCRPLAPSSGAVVGAVLWCRRWCRPLAPSLVPILMPTIDLIGIRLRLRLRFFRQNVKPTGFDPARVLQLLPLSKIFWIGRFEHENSHCCARHIRIFECLGSRGIKYSLGDVF